MPAVGSDVWARLTLENFATAADWGVYPTSPPGSSIWWLDINDENGFSVTREPIRQTRRAATKNYRRRRIYKRTQLRGTVNGILFPEQAANWITLACNPALLSGQLQLPSFTADWHDGVADRRFLGGRVSRFSLTSDNQNDWLTLSADIIFKSETTPGTFAQPAVTVYPTSGGYTHQDSSGIVQLGTSAGTVITGYRRLMISYENLLDPQFDELPWLNICDYCGRNVDWEIVLQNTDASFRQHFEAQDQLTAQVSWSQASPPHNVTFTMTSDRIEGNTIDRRFGSSQYQTLRLWAFQDMTTGADATASAA
jgi:hypothetical protein